MHRIKDENGNVCPHSHGHEHTHEHTHQGCETSECGHCSSCSDEEGGKNKEIIALLTYMLQHNEHHAAELDQMADNLEKMGMATAAKTIREGVSDFQKGNMRLGLALTLVKEEISK